MNNKENTFTVTARCEMQKKRLKCCPITSQASTTHEVDQNDTILGVTQAMWGNTLGNDFEFKKYLFLVKYGEKKHFIMGLIASGRKKILLCQKM